MSTGSRIIYGIVTLVVIFLVYMLTALVEDNRERSKKEREDAEVAKKSGEIVQARLKLQEYYRQIEPIRREVEDCLRQKGYTIVPGDENSVKKEDYDLCMNVIHSMRGFTDIPELEKLATTPLPK